MELVREFAGAERRFRLRLGDILDLERACDQTGLGAIYKRLAMHDWSVIHVRHVLRYALRGGGMEMQDATRIVDERIDVGQLVQLHGLAIEVLVSLMEGIEPDETKPSGDPAVPMDAGEIFAAFARLGIAPRDVRGISYSDFVLMARAMSGDTLQPPSEDEFRAMLDRYEERYGERH